MAITEKITIIKEESKQYPPLPENFYQIELLDVNAKQAETYGSKKNKDTKEKEYETILAFQYTLLGGKNKEGEDLRGRNVWDNFVPAMLYVGKKGKNKLYKIVEALLDRELTQEEEAMGIDQDFLNELIGRQMRIGTENKEGKTGGNVFTNAESYYPAETQLESLTDEEKDKATVKNKKEDEAKTGTSDVGGIEYPEEEINPDDVPF